MIKPEALQEISDKMEFPADELNFVHPDQMESKINNLTSTHPGIKSRIIGHSRQGRDIWAVEVGKGEKRIFAVGGAHSDEPTGTVTLLHLTKEIAKLQEKGNLAEYQFIFIPQIDPDGTVFNWPWMENFSFKNHTRFLFRQKNPANDIEHCIPISPDQTIRPEGAAFKQYIDKLAPIDYYVSLHSTFLLQGAVFILSSPAPERHTSVINFLTETCRLSGLEMEDEDLHGQYGIRKIAPGFLTDSNVAEMKNLYKNNPDALKRIKMSTIEYAQTQCGAKMALISELPFIVNTEILSDEDEETNVSMYDYMSESLRRQENDYRRYAAMWNDLAGFPYSEAGKHRREVYEFMFTHKFKNIESQRGDLDRFKGKRAKTSYLHDFYFDKYITEYTLPLVALHRLEGVETKEAREAFAFYEKQFEEKWYEYEKRLSHRILPLSEQVKLQSAMILSGMLEQ